MLNVILSDFIHIYFHIYIYIYIYVCVCVCVCIYICIYILWACFIEITEKKSLAFYSAFLV